MTPVLWCALDFGRRLTTPVRATVCISLEQYAVGASFDELPQTLLSAGLGASVAMARRFRRAQLDSMIYSAATRGAIWRGPSLDDPAAMPTEALALTKEALNATVFHGFAEQLELERDLQNRAGATADFAEGVAAFLEKRQRQFRGQ